MPAGLHTCRLMRSYSYIHWWCSRCHLYSCSLCMT